MHKTEFILFILTYTGLAILLARASILTPLKERLLERFNITDGLLAEFLYCAQCIGFWAGLSMVFYKPELTFATAMIVPLLATIIDKYLDEPI